MKKSQKNKGGIFIERKLFLSKAYISLSRTALIILLAFLDARERNPNKKGKKKQGNKKQPEFINLDCIEMPYETLVKKYGLNRSSIPRGMDELMAKGFIRITYHGGSCKHDKNQYALVDDYLIWEPGMRSFHERPKRAGRGYQGRRLGATATDEKFICDYCLEETDHVKKTNKGFKSCTDCLTEGSFELSPEQFGNLHAQNHTHTHAQNHTLREPLRVLK